MGFKEQVGNKAKNSVKKNSEISDALRKKGERLPVSFSPQSCCDLSSFSVS